MTIETVVHSMNTPEAKEFHRAFAGMYAVTMEFLSDGRVLLRAEYLG